VSHLERKANMVGGAERSESKEEVLPETFVEYRNHEAILPLRFQHRKAFGKLNAFTCSSYSGEVCRKGRSRDRPSYHLIDKNAKGEELGRDPSRS